MEDAILNQWQAVLDQSPGSIAIFSPSGEPLRTFADIDARARLIERTFSPLEPGSIVAFPSDNHPDWPAVFLASLRRGLALMPSEPFENPAAHAAACERCRVSAIFTIDPDRLELLSNEVPDWQGKNPVLLKLTSGTTGQPRSLRFRSLQLVADCEQICDGMGLRSTDRSLALIAFAHSYGFSNLITPLLCRGIPLVLCRDKMPMPIASAVQAGQATIFPGVPLLFRALIESPAIDSLRPLRLCVSAGAPLPVETAAAFRAKFGLAIHPFYGASECGGICYGKNDDDALESGHVGRPMSATTIEALDPGKEHTRIVIHGKTVTDGAHPACLGDPSLPGEHRFVPADLVQLDARGVRIASRTGEMINIGGRKIAPGEVESVLRAHPAVADCAVFGIAHATRVEEMVASVVLRHPVADRMLRSHCVERLPSWKVPGRFWRLDALPYNSRGKIVRSELTRQYHLAQKVTIPKPAPECDKIASFSQGKSVDTSSPE